MNTETQIKQKLQDGLSINHLDITNESHMHNVPEGSESHFRVVVVSDAFSDQPLIKRHRAVNQILKEELAGRVHALALHTFTPDEWQARGETTQASPECRGGSSR
jgi:BolA protein